MSLNTFVPSIWANEIQVGLRKTLVYASLANRDYEGEIANFGDTVKINEIAPVTVNAYTKYSAITWETLDSAQKMLKIDQQKYFAFIVDDIDNAQTKPKVMANAMLEASYSIADTIDQFVASLYTDAGIGNSTYLGTLSSAVSLSSGNVIEKFSYMMRYMDDGKIPREGRWCVIPPWIYQKLILAETGGIAATAVPKVFNDGTIVNGFVGQVMGLNLFISHNVPTSSTTYVVLAGTNRSITFASQIAKVEAVRRQDYFEEGIKGLYVYGGKVVRPDTLCASYFTESAG